MASVNKVILVGYLGRDPEIRQLPDGTPIASVSLATSHRYKDRETGESKEETEWHRVVLGNRLGEIASEYLKKGAQIYVEGKLRHRKWRDKEGRERHTTEIVASAMQMLGARAGNGTGEQAQASPKRQQKAGGAPAAPIPEARRHGRRYPFLSESMRLAQLKPSFAGAFSDALIASSTQDVGQSFCNTTPALPASFATVP